MVHDDKSYYSDWRDMDLNVVEALRSNKILPTDKRIIISLPLMAIILIAYSLTYFFNSNLDFTGFIISGELLSIFLCFIPVKKYFSTF